MLIVEFNVQIFTVECTDIYKNTKKTSIGLRYSLFIQLSFNGHSPRSSPGVGHVVLTKLKIMYPVYVLHWPIVLLPSSYTDHYLIILVSGPDLVPRVFLPGFGGGAGKSREKRPGLFPC